MRTPLPARGDPYENPEFSRCFCAPVPAPPVGKQRFASGNSLDTPPPPDTIRGGFGLRVETFPTEGCVMAEKVEKLGVNRDKDFMYYVKDGAVWRVQRKQPGVTKGKPEKVADGNFQMDTNFIYFVDKDGDVSRAKRAVGGQKRKKTPAKSKAAGKKSSRAKSSSKTRSAAKAKQLAQPPPPAANPKPSQGPAPTREKNTSKAGKTKSAKRGSARRAPITIPERSPQKVDSKVDKVDRKGRLAHQPVGLPASTAAVPL